MEEISQKQCTDELYKTVKREFLSEGLLRELRCELQTRILDMMRGEREKGESLSGANVNNASKVLGGVDARGLPHGDMRIVLTNQLIMEYLHWYGYKYTAQTLSMETGTENKPPLRESLEGMVGPTNCHQLPIILEIVAKMVERQQRRINRGTYALEQEESCTPMTNYEAQGTKGLEAGTCSDTLKFSYMDFSCESSISVASKQLVEITPSSMVVPDSSFEKILEKNTESYVDICSSTFDRRLQPPLYEQSQAQQRQVRPFRDTDTVLPSHKDSCVVNGSENYFENSTEVFDGHSEGTETTIFARSFSNLIDEEISDSYSVEGNFGTTPTETSFCAQSSIRNFVKRTGSNFVDQIEDNMDHQVETYSDKKTNHVQSEVGGNVEDNSKKDYAKHLKKISIEHKSFEREQMECNDRCYTEGLEANSTSSEKLEPGEYGSQNSSYYDESYAYEEEENLISKDDYEEIFDDEDDEYLDDEVYNKKVKFLQRELQIAMMRKLQRKDDEGETDEDISEGTNCEKQCDEDNDSPYQRVLKETNEIHDEQEEDDTEE